MKTIKDTNLENKKVLVRCDFNVPLDEEENITDDFRIQQSLPTIKYLIEKKAKVILMSHLGKPGGKVVENLRLTPVKDRIENYLKISIDKADDCIGEEVKKKIEKMKEGDVLLLENLRFHSGEESNDLEFARQLADLGDIYVNDAFGTCHRKHASIVGIPKFLPSFAGLLLKKELDAFSKVVLNPSRPLVVIIGGAKIESKIKVIKYFLKNSDHLLIGGKIANSILIVKGVLLGRPWPDEEVVKEIKKFDLTSPNLHLPVDVLASPTETGKYGTRVSAPGRVRKDELLLDIGPETIKMFSKIISSASTIIWAGPMGFFENPLFEKGTREIAEAIIKNQKAFKVAGGGDTISALRKFHLEEWFNHISTGGGAMLGFLAGEELPGISALER